MPTSQWQRWNPTTHIFELSTDFGVTWNPLTLVGIFSLVFNLAITDALAHSSSAVAQNRSGYITIASATGGTTYIPFFANGGSASFKWTYLDPDTGWTINSSGTFSFQDGAAVNTYSITFTAATGVITVQRTAGAANYTINIYTI